ncbi:MAG: pyridoxal phosphate-dependent aminotransferase EpsN [Cyclobacteriaceae bacterium]
MKTEKIYLSPPELTGKESAWINDILMSNWIAPVGPHLAQFEEKISKFTGFKYALAVNSGTSAIHLSLLCHNIKKNDLVLSSSLTFCGAVNPILYVGAKPILIDSNFNDWNIDSSLLVEGIESAPKKPKAILITHLFGMPADFEKIESIGKRYNIPVIHDLAEAIGCRINDRKPGTYAGSAIVSFNGNKLITTSAGGALLTNNHNHYKRGLLLSTQAKSQGTSYNHSELGYNYRMSNVLAGLGLGQFSSIESKIEKKRNIFEYYQKTLGTITGIEFQTEKPSHFSDRWLSVVFFNPSFFKKGIVSKIIEVLSSINIESRHIWKPMHLQPLYKHVKIIGGNVSETLFENGICLPSGTGLKRSDQDRVIEAIVSTLKAYQ